MAAVPIDIVVQAPSVASDDIAHLASLTDPDAIEAIPARPGATVVAWRLRGIHDAGGVREACAVRVSMSTAARCARSSATTWSSFSGRTGASLFPTIATVLKGGGMGPN